jgi:TRAP-type mannitol/chloroaromatic compound transport system permease small subunit
LSPRRAIDVLTDLIGRSVAWCALLMVLITLVVVALRYLFSEGSIVLQESVMYLHALVFMLGIPYALRHDAHVRVDVISSRLSERQRAVVEIVGHLIFLLPLCITVFVTSLPYVAASWRVLEGSGEVGGIPLVFLLKTLIPLTALLLAMQAVAETGRRIPLLRAAGSAR